MAPYLGLQRKLFPTAQVSSLTTGSVTLPSARQALGTGYEAIVSYRLINTTSEVQIFNVPQDYKHLQIRICAQTNRATYNYDSHRMRLNGVSTTSYEERGMNNDPAGGSGAQAYAASRTYFFLPLAGTTVKNNWGFTIIDIYDYTDTSKFKSIRVTGGSDSNGSDGGYRSYTNLVQGTFLSTNAITSMRFQSDAGNYLSGSTFSLYGVRG